MYRLAPPSLRTVVRLLLLLLALCASPAFAAPRVVVSIKPLHSLVAGVMEGVDEPSLIVQGSASPHAFQLQPSQARSLREADVVFYVSENYEIFLRPVLNGLPAAHKVALMDAPGITRLPVRHGEEWAAHAEGNTDFHAWLDVANARAMVQAVAATLSVQDVSNASRYRANAKALDTRLAALDAELRETLTPLKGKSFLVFHDAYHYAEARYGLKAAGSVSAHGEQGLGPRHVQGLRKRLQTENISCLFREPNFPQSKAEALVQGTPAQVGVLDAEGLSLTPGGEMYFNLMRGVMAGLRACLSY